MNQLWWSLSTHHIICYGVLVYFYKFADCVSWSLMCTCASFMCRYLLCPMVQVTNGSWAHKQNLLQICFLLISLNDPIMSTFCLCHGSPLVATCVQLSFHCMIIVHVYVTYIIAKFRLWAHKPFVEGFHKINILLNGQHRSGKHQLQQRCVHVPRPEQSGWYFADDIFKCIY